VHIADLLRNMRILQSDKSVNDLIPRVALLLMGGIGSLLEAVGIALIFPLISVLNNPGYIETSAALSWLHAFLAPSSFTQFAIYLVAGIALVFFLKNLFMVWVYYLQASYAARQRVSLSNRIFRLYMLAPYGDHQRRNTAELIRNIANLVEGPFSAFTVAKMGLIADALAILGIAAVLVSFHPVVTLSAGGVLFALFFLQSRAFSPLFHRMGVETAKLAHEQQAFLQSSLGGLKETKVLRRESYFLDAFSLIQDRFARCMRNYQFANRLPPIISEMVLLVVILIIISIILNSVDSIETVLASLALLAGAAFRLQPLFNRVLSSLNSIRHSYEGISILAREITELESSQSTSLPETHGSVPFCTDLRLDDISFRYRGAPDPTLKNISLTIRKGDFVGLVGRTGAGKTTLADILLGLHDLDSGRMVVDSTDITKSLNTWRFNTGYVPQDIFITNDTIRRNVAFGLPDDMIDDTKILHALELAQLNEFLTHQHQGLDAMLGERGVMISGGQRQRIGIARALYHDPEVLVFDEATSSLDTQTEHALTNAIRMLKGDKTIIVIAHRLSTVKDCDQLFFMQDGTISASGTYDQLLSESDAFAEIVRLSQQPEGQP